MKETCQVNYGCANPSQSVEVQEKKKETWKKNYGGNIFIKRAMKVHGDKYIYTKSQYLNAMTKICITCKEQGHGDFWQNHLIT